MNQPSPYLPASPDVDVRYWLVDSASLSPAARLGFIGDHLRTRNCDKTRDRIAYDCLLLSFRDANRITRGLGIYLLWIGSLRIMQDSLTDWEKEASRMDQVYAGSCCALATVHSCYISRNVADKVFRIGFRDRSSICRSWPWTLMRVDISKRSLGECGAGNRRVWPSKRGLRHFTYIRTLNHPLERPFSVTICSCRHLSRPHQDHLSHHPPSAKAARTTCKNERHL